MISTESKKPECDLVMKGGITSGVVYPSAVLKLAEKYRFRNIGGASVGAIAAALVAAAEMGRQSGEGTGLDELDAMNREVERPGFLLKLFQPQRGVGGAFDLLIALMTPGLRGMVNAVAVLFRRTWFVIVPALVVWGVLLGVIAAILGRWWWILPVTAGAWGLMLGVLLGVLSRRPLVGLAGFIGGVLSAALWPLILGPAMIAGSTFRTLNEKDFGMCTGITQGSGPAVTEWLHDHIQRSVGRTVEDPQPGGEGEGSRPLTFGDLAKYDIDLQMMTTNLSTARPVRLPAEAEDYLFREEDMARLFPARVVAHLVKHSRHVQDQQLAAAGYSQMPLAKDIPVLVGFRMSLSFPVLFTAVPLYGFHPNDTKKVVRNWFSDGGIGSNFPIHFFDAWLPSRPTFGLSLGPYPKDAEGRPVPGEGDIGLPVPPTLFPVPNWIGVSSLGSFLQQILETMQNWRDAMQSELPGFQDRVYQVRLSPSQGGMNLNMTDADIRDLIRKGRDAGQAINDNFKWEQHFFTRYVTYMQMTQIGLSGEDDPATGIHRRGLRENFEAFRKAFADGAPGAGYLFTHDPAWCREAGEHTWTLADGAVRWHRPASDGDPGFVGFNSGPEPRPKPSMRIVPRV